MELQIGYMKKNLLFVKAFDWNADGTKLAFIRFDESQVPEFSMDIYSQGLYPTQSVLNIQKQVKKCCCFFTYL